MPTTIDCLRGINNSLQLMNVKNNNNNNNNNIDDGNNNNIDGNKNDKD